MDQRIEMVASLTSEMGARLFPFMRLATEYPSKPWFAAAPIGENKLGTMVKYMFAEVGIAGKTNHSLRATGATNLYTANVPEQSDSG